MFKIEMTEGNLLVRRKEEEKTEFLTSGSLEKNVAIFEVVESAANELFDVGALLLLKPGTYPGVNINNELLTYITEDDVLAELEEEKDAS